MWSMKEMKRSLQVISKLPDDPVQPHEHCKEHQVYDSKSTDVTDRLLFRSRERRVELVCDKARHARDQSSQAAEIRSDDERFSVIRKGRQQERRGYIADDL